MLDVALRILVGLFFRLAAVLYLSGNSFCLSGGSLGFRSYSVGSGFHRSGLRSGSVDLRFGCRSLCGSLRSFSRGFRGSLGSSSRGSFDSFGFRFVDLFLSSRCSGIFHSSSAGFGACFHGFFNRLCECSGGAHGNHHRYHHDKLFHNRIIIIVMTDESTGRDRRKDCFARRN